MDNNTCNMNVMEDIKMEGVDITLMSAEMLISGGVRVMDGHCWGPSPMLIQDRANSPWAHSFWRVHLDRVTDGNHNYHAILRLEDSTKRQGYLIFCTEYVMEN